MSERDSIKNLDTLQRLPDLDDEDFFDWPLDSLKSYQSPESSSIERELQEEQAQRRYDSLNKLYDLDHPKRPPNFTGNPRDYYSDEQIKLGRRYRNELFFNLRDYEQQQYGRVRAEFERDLKAKGYDIDDPDVQDILDYEAGEAFVRKLINAADDGPLKKYYYRKFKSKDWWYEEPSKDMVNEFEDFMDDIYDFYDDAMQVTDFIDDFFGT